MAKVSEKQRVDPLSDGEGAEECPHRLRRQRYPGKGISRGRRRVTTGAGEGATSHSERSTPACCEPQTQRPHLPRPPRLPA